MDTLSEREGSEHMSESVFDDLLKRLHEAQDNMYIYYDDGKQTSEEEKGTEDDVHEFWLEAMRSSGSLADSAEGEYIKKETLLKYCTYVELANGNKGWVLEKGYIEDLPTYSFPDREKAISEIETDMSHFCFDDWGNENATWTEIKKILRGKDK